MLVSTPIPKLLANFINSSLAKFHFHIYDTINNIVRFFFVWVEILWMNEWKVEFKKKQFRSS